MKIRNRQVRRILRQIYHWDTCPMDYRKDFTAVIFNSIMRAALCVIIIICMAFVICTLS